MSGYGSGFQRRYYCFSTFSIFLLICFSFNLSIYANEESLLKVKAPKVIVLDDCDSDNIIVTLPAGDNILILDSDGEILKTISGLKVKKVTGENKALSISEDGRFFAVCENAAKKLTIFETATSKEY